MAEWGWAGELGDPNRAQGFAFNCMPYLYLWQRSWHHAGQVFGAWLSLLFPMSLPEAVTLGLGIEAW